MSTASAEGAAWGRGEEAPPARSRIGSDALVAASHPIR